MQLCEFGPAGQNLQTSKWCHTWGETGGSSRLPYEPVDIKEIVCEDNTTLWFH